MSQYRHTPARATKITRGTAVAVTIKGRSETGVVARLNHDFAIVHIDGHGKRRVLKQRLEPLTTPPNRT